MKGAAISSIADGARGTSVPTMTSPTTDFGGGFYLMYSNKNIDARVDIESLGSVENWGDCAKACHDKNTISDPDLCKWWTWASSDCENCIPGTCWVIRDTQTPEKVPRRGFLSGSVRCQDIANMADDAAKIVDSSHLTKIKDYGPNFSLCPVAGEDCPAQVVPGFRFEFNCNFFLWT